MNEKTQTRKSLVDKVYADMNNVRKSTVEDVVNKFIEAMTESLKAGDRIEIRGLGVFTTKLRKRYRRFDFTTQSVIDDEREVRTIMFTQSSQIKDSYKKDNEIKG